MSTHPKYPHARGVCPDCGTDGWHPIQSDQPAGIELECAGCASHFYVAELVGAMRKGRIVNMSAITALGDIARRRQAAAAELARIDASRDDAIIAAIEAGHGAPTIAAHAGLTAARVYQIRNARR